MPGLNWQISCTVSRCALLSATMTSLEKGSLKWPWIMLQWFIRFSEFAACTEFPFIKKNSTLSNQIIWVQKSRQFEDPLTIACQLSSEITGKTTLQIWGSVKLTHRYSGGGGGRIQWQQAWMLHNFYEPPWTTMIDPNLLQFSFCCKSQYWHYDL